MECAAWINTILPRCLQPLARAAQKLQKRRQFKSPAEAYMASPEAWAEAGIDEKTVNKFIARRDFNYPAWLKDFCLNNGITILTPEDDAYPYSLKQIASPPQVLYVKGSLPDLRGSIGIVGSREASGYGLLQATALKLPMPLRQTLPRRALLL